MPGRTRPPGRGPTEQPAMPFPEGGEPVKKGEEGKARTLSRFLDWLGKVLVEEAKVEAWTANQTPPLTILHEVTLRERSLEEVLSKGAIEIKNLEEAKKRLVGEFGSRASSFISKCIDSKLDRLHVLIRDLTASETTNHSFPALLAQAVESVELLSQFNDESKIRREIVHDAQNFIHQAIENDMEMLANYKQDALDLLRLTPQERKEREMLLDRFLYPIMRELKGMASSHMETDDLHAFCGWITNVDDRRNFLVELGMSTAETLTGKKGMRVEGMTEGEITEENELHVIAAAQEEHSDLLSRLSNLEDRTGKFLTLLKSTSLIDRESIKLIEQLFVDLKNEAESFASQGFDSEKISSDFLLLQQKLSEAEEILNSHKKI